MNFEDSFYQFRILSRSASGPMGYIMIQDPQPGALARYLITKSSGNPGFEAFLHSFCPKTEDLINPYDTDIEEAYLKELAFRLAGCNVWYRKKGGEILERPHSLLSNQKAEEFPNITRDHHFIPPWASSGGGGIGGGSAGGATTSSNANSGPHNSGSGNHGYESDSIRAHMEQMRRISSYSSPRVNNAAPGISSRKAPNPLTDWLEINLYYADQHKTPVFDQPYQVILPDGSLRTGTVNRNGYARLDGIPKGNAKVEIQEDPSQRARLRKLHDQLEATLDQLVDQAAQANLAQKSANADINPFEEGLVYVGAFMMGGVDMVSDLWAFAKLVGQGLVKAQLAYLDLLEDFFRGDARAIQKKLETAQQAGMGAYQAASETSEAIYLLVTDEETWEILTNFVEDYWEASSGVDLTRTTAPAVIEILITIITAGAGAPVLTANLGKAAKLTEKAASILEQIIKAKKALGQKITKSTATSKQVIVPIKKNVGSKKSTTPDWSSVKHNKDFSARIAAKRFEAGNLAEAQAQLAKRRKEIAKQGYQPKYNDAELAYLAQHGNIAEERFQVRFMETRYLVNRDAPHDHLSGAMGMPMQGETGKGAKYWSTSLDQLEDADSDPKLISEKLGLTYKPEKDYSLVIIDTEKSTPLTGVKSVPATFENVSEFANTELPKKFPASFTDKVMTPEFQAEYAKHYKAAEKAKVFKKEWSVTKFSEYLQTTTLSSADKRLMKQRFQMHKVIGNNEDYLGDGLTKNNNASVSQQYGAVETLNFERKEINLSQLSEINAITIIPGMRPL